MTTCTEKHHPNHAHKHGPNCGHTAVRHAAAGLTIASGLGLAPHSRKADRDMRNVAELLPLADGR